MNRELIIYKSAPVGGLKANYEVPDSLDALVASLTEYHTSKGKDKKAAKAAANETILGVFINDVIFHKVNTSLRSELTDAIIEESKVDGKPTFEPLTEKKTVGTKEVEVAIETDEEFVRRALVDGKVSRDWLVAKFAELAAHPDNGFITYCVGAGRTKAPKSAPKAAQQRINEYVASGKLAEAVAKFGQALGEQPADTNDLTACAMQYWRWREKQLALLENV